MLVLHTSYVKSILNDQNIVNYCTSCTLTETILDIFALLLGLIVQQEIFWKLNF